jgi:hypothetical protein
VRLALWRIWYTGPIAWLRYRWLVLHYFRAVRGTDYYDPDRNMPPSLPWLAWLEFMREHLWL